MTIDKDNQQFKDALNIIKFTNNSLFITGKAGTGKSTLLKYICENTTKEKVVLAPTGIAAINVGGATLHSFFKLPFYPLTPEDANFSSPKRLKAFLKYNSQHIKLIKKLEMVIIDEISMVRADIIDFIDKVLRVYSGNMRQPFGGKQMVFVGDVFQLEPVVTRDEKDILSRFYPSAFFFHAHTFRQIPMVTIELTKVYRQSDMAFISLLDHIRSNHVSNADLQLLNLQVDSSEKTTTEDFTITLATRRDVVDSINKTNLDNIDLHPTIFKGTVNGDFPINSLPTSLELELKPGAQVIFIKNDMDKRWVNGTIGVVEGISEQGDTIYVLTDDDMHYEVEPVMWKNIRYKYNSEEKKIEEEELGTFTQLPVKLAWAITIHKSQGLTFSNVNIDLSGGAFAGGQTYVALSRCRSLDGISLQSPIGRGDIFVNQHVLEFSKTFNDKNSMNAALKMAEADIRYKDAVEAFDRGDFQSFLDNFFVAIHARYDIEKPLQKRFIRRKLEVINSKERECERLRKQVQEAKATIRKKDKFLSELSDEYVQMGIVCIELDDMKSAAANYDKALRLNPKSVGALLGKADILRRSGQLRKALTQVGKALKVSPNSFDSILLRGKVLFELHKYDEAVEELERCTSLQPESIVAHRLYGDLLSAMGLDDNAAIHYLIADRLEHKKKNKN